METNKIKVSRGATFKGCLSLFGLGVFIGSIFLSIFLGPLFFIGICIGMASFFLFLSITGVIIDFEKNQYKEYFNFLFIEFGKYKDLKTFSKVEIEFKKDRVSTTKPTGRSSYKINVFSVFLTNEEGNKRLLLRTYSDQKKAQELADRINGKMQM